MKKILFALGGEDFPTAAFNFLIQLNSLKPILVTGVFLPSMITPEMISSFEVSGSYYFSGLEDDEQNRIEKNIEHFKTLCRRHNMQYQVHSGFTTKFILELKEETRFADLLVIGTREFYQYLDEKTQIDFLKRILHKSECPVLLIPEAEFVPQNIVLAYDGSESSVYAIKQFFYLFPEYANLPTLLIYTNTGHNPIPEKDNIQELASHHFNDLVVFKLKVDTGQEFRQWLRTNKYVILVAGAYGRSYLSEMLQKSYMQDFITDDKMYVFVAHK